jgi:hypothetical protein
VQALEDDGGQRGDAEHRRQRREELVGALHSRGPSSGLPRNARG